VRSSRAGGGASGSSGVVVGDGEAEFLEFGDELAQAAVVVEPGAELARAADGFRRAARAPWGRVPASSLPGPCSAPPPTCWPAACPSTGGPPSAARSSPRALLARAVTKMHREQMRAEQAHRAREERARKLRDPHVPKRKDQVRSLQAEAAHQAAQNLAATAATPPGTLTRPSSPLRRRTRRHPEPGQPVRTQPPGAGRPDPVIPAGSECAACARRPSGCSRSRRQWTAAAQVVGFAPVPARPALCRSRR
jgi:hypothetical protein